ncbi:MAG: zf-HC2 domain-containing protein [Planctomycetes bacterium]|nr:zf-HC2 domain-containing protein [Planctomycetota bacterium]
MNCQSARKHLPLYVGRDLPDEMCKEVALHLVECESCQAQVRAYQESHRALLELGAQGLTPQAMETLQRSVKQRVRRQGFQPFEPAASPHRWRSWCLGAAAAAVVGLVLTTWLKSPPPPLPALNAPQATPPAPPLASTEPEPSIAPLTFSENDRVLPPVFTMEPEEEGEIEILFPTERVHARLDVPAFPPTLEGNRGRITSRDETFREEARATRVRARLVSF